MADTVADPAVDFLLGLGTDATGHAGESLFIDHLTETRDYLRRWGCEQHVCESGLFHSIYGTEAFQPKESLPVRGPPPLILLCPPPLKCVRARWVGWQVSERAVVAATIGPRAERLR